MILYFVVFQFYLRRAHCALAIFNSIFVEVHRSNVITFKSNFIFLVALHVFVLHDIDPHPRVLILIRACFIFLYSFDLIIMNVCCKYVVCTLILLSLLYMLYDILFDFFVALNYA